MSQYVGIYGSVCSGPNLVKVILYYIRLNLWRSLGHGKYTIHKLCMDYKIEINKNGGGYVFLHLLGVTRHFLVNQPCETSRRSLQTIQSIVM